MMKSYARFFLFGMIPCLHLGCSVPATSPTTSPYSPPRWPLGSIKDWPVTTQVESPTAFTYQGVRCKLLGVKVPQDPGTRERAITFVKDWLAEGNKAHILDFYNSSNPLVDADGACVVWACRWHLSCYCLNIDLVAAGLADVDYSAFSNYEFTVPAKSGPDPQANWRRALDEAFAKRGTGVDSTKIDW